MVVTYYMYGFGFNCLTVDLWLDCWYCDAFLQRCGYYSAEFFSFVD